VEGPEAVRHAGLESDPAARSRFSYRNSSRSSPTVCNFHRGSLPCSQPSDEPLTPSGAPPGLDAGRPHPGRRHLGRVAARSPRE
jgi:hypothetical protein